MKRVAELLVAAAALAGCVVQPAGRTAVASQGVWTGEVWTWDQEASTVTLLQDGRLVRVKVTPDQIVGLRRSQVATVRGELAGATEIQTTIVATPTTYARRGAPDLAEATGTVKAVDPAGRLAIDSPRGPLEVWTAMPGSRTFRAGDRVRVWMSVQPLERVVSAGPAPAGPAPEPAIPVPAEPGDYAAVIGMVTAVAPSAVTVQSPRGPITVSVPGPARYRVADFVEVRTSVHPVR